MKEKTLTGILAIVILVSLSVSGFYIGEKLSQEKEEKDQLSFVSGTEYYPGDEGEVAVLLTNSQGQAITGSYNCQYTVLFPNKTTFISGNLSTLSSQGVRSDQFTVPDTYGVYEYSALCINGAQQSRAAKSFHVGRATDTILDDVNRMGAWTTR